MEFRLVHSNSEIDLFSLAARGHVHLFYDTKGGAPIGHMSENEFHRRAEYWVPSEKAMKLRDLILVKATSEHIVRELGLFYRDPWGFLVREEVEEHVVLRRNIALSRGHNFHRPILVRNGIGGLGQEVPCDYIPSSRRIPVMGPDLDLPKWWPR